MRRLALAAAGLVLAALAGCNTIAPPPPLPADAAISRPAAHAPFLGASSALVAQAEVPGDWWRLYDSPALDALVAHALAANTDLRAAGANLEKAQAGLDYADAAREPSTSVYAAPSYGRRSAEEDLHPGKPFPNKFVYGTGLSVSWQVDLFGQIARGIAAAQDDVGAATAARDAVRVTVVAETTRAYLDACATGREIAVADRLVALQQKSTELTRTLVANGRAGSIDTTRSSVQEDQVRATLPQLDARRRLALYRLAVLTGQTPSEFPRDVAACEQEPRLAAPLPVGDGAGLLKRRPDVRRAEFEVQAASERIGVVTADLYPKVSLGASIASVGQLQRGFSDDTFKFSLGPLLTWEFPDRSRTRARIRAADADREIALARFDGTVLGALKETESALEVYSEDARRRAILEAARGKAADAARDTERLFTLGRQGYLPVLDANRTLIALEQSTAAADSRLAADQVDLFLALGGGWQDVPKP